MLVSDRTPVTTSGVVDVARWDAEVVMVLIPLMDEEEVG